MRSHARILLAGLLMTTWGCGGPEFVAAPGSGEDGGPGSDAATTDATLTSDAATLADGAPRPSDASDGATSATDSGDAGTGATDGGDAGTKPGDGGDAGPAAFACPSPDPAAVFCSTFDKTSSPPWDWASDPITPKAAEAADTTDFLSSPNGFAASNQGLIVTNSAQIASLGKPLTSLALHIDYSFHLFVKQYDTVDNPSIPVAQLTVDPSTASALSLQIVLKGGALSFVQLYTGTDGGQQTTSPLSVGAASTGAWVAVELLLDRSGVNWTAQVFLDGVSKLIAQTAATPSSQSLEVDLGILLVLPTTTANALTFDNVLVRAY